MTAPVLQPDIWRSSDPSSVARMRTILEIDQRTSETFTASLPFSLNDTTAGSENELQTVVIGKKQGKIDILLFPDNNGLKLIFRT